MAKKIIRAVNFKRKRSGQTDYKKRLSYLVSKKPRVVIRKTSKHFIVHVVNYNPDGDKTEVMVNSKTLEKYGWKYNKSNMPSAYLTGLLVGKLAKEKKISEIIADLGRQVSLHGGKFFAVIKGLVDAGVNVPHKDICFPADDRINGSHIASYATQLKEDKEKFNKQYSSLIKNKVEPTSITEEFEKAKAKILGA